MWKNVRREIEATFETLSSCVDVHDLVGLRVERGTSRATTKEPLTPEQRRARRADLERNRREYKTKKQREYDAKKRAA